MPPANPAVVASLAEGSMNPFSCVSLSPSRDYAIAAAKDTLNLIRIDPGGIRSLRKIKISQVPIVVERSLRALVLRVPKTFRRCSVLLFLPLLGI